MSVPPPDSLTSDLAPACPNCGQPWPPNAPACPNCGFLRPAVWPPTPQGQSPAGPPTPRLVTKSTTGDILLGLGLSLLLFVAGVGIIVIPILYLSLRSQYPDFGRGLGFGWLTGMALVLGALAVCLVALVYSPQNGR